MRKLIIAVALLLATQRVDAFIVDTGDPTSNYGLGGGVGQSFFLDNNYHINSVSFWFNTPAMNIGSSIVPLSIFSSLNSAPIYSQSFFVDYSADEPTSGWAGVNNIDWFLPQGNYWATLGVNGTSYSLVGVGANPENPAGQGMTFDGGWFNYNGNNPSYALQVEGHHAPEPATMALLGSGFVGMLLRKNKLRRGELPR